jgi:hypothetical protein
VVSVNEDLNEKRWHPVNKSKTENLGQLALGFINLVEEEDNGRYQEPPRVGDALE